MLSSLHKPIYRVCRIAFASRRGGAPITLYGGTALLFVFRVSAIFINFLQSIVLSRVFGAEQLGQQMLVLGLMGLLGVSSRLGLDGALLATAGAAIGRDDERSGAGLAITSLLLVVILSLLLSSIVVVFAGRIATAVGDPNTVTLIQIYALSLISGGLTTQLSVWARAHGAGIGVSVITDLLVSAANLLLAAILGFALDLQNISVFASVSVALQFIVVLVLLALLRSRSAIMQISPTETFAISLCALAPSFWFLGIMAGLVAWLDMLFVSIHLTTLDVVHYGVAVRVSQTLAMIPSITAYLSAPEYAKAHGAKRYDQMSKTYQTNFRLGLLTMLPVFLFLILFGDRVLQLWGESFAMASTALCILAVSQAISVLAQGAGQVLLMTGHERAVRNVTLASMLLALAMLAVLVPIAGIEGAAVASATSIGIAALVKLFLAWRHLALSP